MTEFVGTRAAALAIMLLPGSAVGSLAAKWGLAGSTRLGGAGNLATPTVFRSRDRK